MSENTTGDRRGGNRTDEPSSPYGPQPYGPDEAAGGADSSPYENEPSGEKAKKAEEAKKQTPVDGGEHINTVP